VGVDFNMITALAEKKGGVRREDAYMETLSKTITNLSLVDMLTINVVHTWNNRRGVENQIPCRLDRFIILEQLISPDIFMEASILQCMSSDHWLIRILLT